MPLYGSLYGPYLGGQMGGQIWCRGDEGWRKSRAGVLRPDSYQRRLDSNDDGGQILLNTTVLKLPWLHNYLAPGKIALRGKYRSNKHRTNCHFISSSWQVGKSAYFGVRKWWNLFDSTIGLLHWSGPRLPLGWKFIDDGWERGCVRAAWLDTWLCPDSSRGEMKERRRKPEVLCQLLTTVVSWPHPTYWNVSTKNEKCK